MKTKSGLRPELVVLLIHPRNLIKHNLRLAWDLLNSIERALAKGDERSAYQSISKAGARLDICEEMIITNAWSMPNNFLRWFNKESVNIREAMHFWADGGIAKELASYHFVHKTG